MSASKMARILFFPATLYCQRDLNPCQLHCSSSKDLLRNELARPQLFFFKESNYQYYKPRWKAIVLLMRMFVRQNVIWCDAAAPQKSRITISSILIWTYNPVQSNIQSEKNDWILSVMRSTVTSQVTRDNGLKSNLSFFGQKNCRAVTAAKTSFCRRRLFLFTRWQEIFLNCPHVSLRGLPW